MDDSPPKPHRRLPIATDDPFLTAKVAVPALPRWVVSRQRIETRIAAGALGPLTVITGPPGAGKTVAAASWAANHSSLHPTAWLTLDEYDNRPQVFWAYLVEALRHAAVPIPRRVAARARSGAAEPDFVLQLAAAIVSHNEPVWLVLDDLHLVTGRSQMTGLARLLGNARPALHLAVTSRGDPPAFPLHRYRLSGELTEIRADELAFTVAEAGQLMAQHGITLPGHALEHLTEHAEGWAAALRLAALAINESPDPGQTAEEIASGSGAVASYLMDEVLSTQPPRVRNLLLKTSILDQVSPEIASEVAEDGIAVSELPALAAANAFVQPLPQGWYRYHPMFAEVLRLKLCREAPEEEVPRLRRRAARWLQRHGLIADAVKQAAQADDWQLAAQIVVDEMEVGRLMQPDVLDPLVEVLRNIPQDRAWPQAQPWLVIAAMSLSGTRADASARSLAGAEDILRELPGHQEIPSRLVAALIRLSLARRTGDLPTARAAAAQATVLLGELSPELVERRPELRAQVMARLAPAAQPRAVVPAQAGPVVVESLTEREREVLEHVSQLLDTAEIASELYVSVNTVKSHLKSIFRKLGATSRNEAVRRARSLELM